MSTAASNDLLLHVDQSCQKWPWLRDGTTKAIHNSSGAVGVGNSTHILVFRLLIEDIEVTPQIKYDYQNYVASPRFTDWTVQYLQWTTNPSRLFSGPRCGGLSRSRNDHWIEMGLVGPNVYQIIHRLWLWKMRIFFFIWLCWKYLYSPTSDHHFLNLKVAIFRGVAHFDISRLLCHPQHGPRVMDVQCNSDPTKTTWAAVT